MVPRLWKHSLSSCPLWLWPLWLPFCPDFGGLAGGIPGHLVAAEILKMCNTHKLPMEICDQPRAEGLHTPWQAHTCIRACWCWWWLKCGSCPWESLAPVRLWCQVCTRGHLFIPVAFIFSSLDVSQSWWTLFWEPGTMGTSWWSGWIQETETEKWAAAFVLCFWVNDQSSFSSAAKNTRRFVFWFPLFPVHTRRPSPGLTSYLVCFYFPLIFRMFLLPDFDMIK